MGHDDRRHTADQPPGGANTALRRVTRALTYSEEHPLAQASRLSSRFRLARPVEVHDFPEKGNINQHTYVVTAGTPAPREYLLQRINERVFTRPRSVMLAMIASIEAQRASVAAGRLSPGDEWETITLLETVEGQPFLEAENHRGYSCWRLMVKIPEARTHKSLGEIPDPSERLRIAAEAGRGLAMYGDFTCHMRTDNLENPLPGYRDTRLYYDQLRSVLAGYRTPEEAGALIPADPALRHSTEEHFLVHLSDAEYRRRTSDPEFRPFIDLAREAEAFGTSLLEGMDSGRIRRLAIHGDTKLDNFLFSTRTGRVKALVDLDTIMPHTWLADWGDMVRSLVNVAGEKERDLSRVQVDMDIYRAVARGFLSAAREVTPAEVDLDGGRRPDHRPGAGPQVPHRLPARRQLLQGRPRRPARPQPREGDGAVVALPPAARAREDEARRFIDDLRTDAHA